MSLDLFRLDKKVVVVSGGLGKLGRQFTSALIEAGARVAVLDIAVTGNLAQDSSRKQSGSDNPLFIYCDIILKSLRKSAEAIGPMTLTGNLKFAKVPQNHTRLI